MRFRFSETPWAPDTWFDGGELVDGDIRLSEATVAAIAAGGAWGNCLSSMIVGIAMGDKEIGPHVIFEGSQLWRE